jgi:hypothetical protein
MSEQEEHIATDMHDGTIKIEIAIPKSYLNWVDVRDIVGLTFEYIEGDPAVPSQEESGWHMLTVDNLEGMSEVLEDVDEYTEFPTDFPTHKEVTRRLIEERKRKGDWI